ncbi:MAG: DUF983 domain-containing protein [Candidatus Symbiobacter sp.]|nr:DUF983 domain-containing protein [Candidatus Symbiobacter sp.]
MDAEKNGKKIWQKIGWGLRRRCPHCGIGKLFRGYLTVEAICPQCHADNGKFPSDDAAPYFTLLVVGHIMVPALLEIGRIFPDLSVFWQLLIFLPLTAILTLALLPVVKGGVIAVAAHFGVKRAPLA